MSNVSSKNLTIEIKKIEIKGIENNWFLIDPTILKLIGTNKELIGTLFLSEHRWSKWINFLEDITLEENNDFGKWYWRVLIIAYLYYLTKYKNNIDKIEWTILKSELPLYDIYTKYWFEFEKSEISEFGLNFPELDTDISELDKSDFYGEKENFNTILKELKNKNIHNIKLIIDNKEIYIH